MRGRGRRKTIPARSRTGEPTAARETLERRWFSQVTHDRSLAPLVTGASLADEPFHRWLPFKQAFAPELVRRFLAETSDARTTKQPLLDPFAGSGTFAVECARQRIEALGIEALRSLVFVASVKAADHVADLPDLSGCVTWQDMAERLDEPVHRAALICAVARRHTSRGTVAKNAPPLLDVLDEVLEMMRQDIRTPLPTAVRVEPGDARRLTSVDPGSIGGILTSPPYLSRHDYTLTTRPHEKVYRYWHPGRDLSQRRDDQLRAHPKAYRRDWSAKPHPAVGEACEALAAAGEVKLAGVVRSYFEDLMSAFGECSRVLRPGGPCWIVVGGARLKGIYVPTDLILAESVRGCGFDVEQIRMARRLTPGGRKLGGLANVAPRESILVLRRAG